MQWAYCGIRKVREYKVRYNPVGARNFEGLGASGRLGSWRVYYYSCISTDFLVDHFTSWREVERFFAKFFGFLFNNTCLCYLCVCFSLSYSIPFNCYCVCD